MSYQTSGQQQVLYKADSQTVHSLKSIRDHLHQICRSHTNQLVRIETLDGQVYVGRIVNCDRGLLHLAVPRQQGAQRAFFGGPFVSPSDAAILTLVLYELLVITLLYT